MAVHRRGAADRGLAARERADGHAVQPWGCSLCFLEIGWEAISYVDNRTNSNVVRALFRYEWRYGNGTARPFANEQAA
jgi:hypothetical protein